MQQMERIGVPTVISPMNNQAIIHFSLARPDLFGQQSGTHGAGLLSGAAEGT